MLIGLLLIAGWQLWQQDRSQVQLAQVRQLIAESKASTDLVERLRLALVANEQLDNFETQAALFAAMEQLPPHLITVLPHDTGRNCPDTP